MLSVLIVAWLFCMVAFACLGGAFALGSALRKGVSAPCCVPDRVSDAGKARDRLRRVGRRSAPGRPAEAVPADRRRPLLSRESRLEMLQRGFVDGVLSVEQYEREVDRLLGVAS